MTRYHVKTETARGIFIGAAVGDALGWPQELRGGLIGGQKARDRLEPRPEFRGWIRSAGYQAHRYRDPVRPGEYSDDTQLLLATARACLTGHRWWERLTQVELPTWPLYQRGGGGAVLTAASSWADNRPPWAGGGSSKAASSQKRYLGAGANGVAMRIAPHVLWATNVDELIERVFRDGITTHGHPRALVGALTYACALHHAAISTDTLEYGESVEAALRGLVDAEQVIPLLPGNWGDIGSFAKTWDKTNREMSQLLEEVRLSLRQGAMSQPTATLEQLGCIDPKINGAGTVTAAAAIYLAARFAARPQGGLLAAAFLRGGDTDTLASMTAAALGAIHGVAWMGKLADAVQDASYLERLATQVAERRTVQLPWSDKRPSTLRKAFREVLASGTEPIIKDFPDGRQYAFERLEDIDEGKARRASLRLSDGQLVFVDVRASSQGTHKTPDPGLGDAARSMVSASGFGQLRLPVGPPEAADARVKVSESDHGHVASVVLPTGHLSRSAAFYAQLLGEELTIRQQRVEVAPNLVLQQSTKHIDPEQVELVLLVNDLGAAARRLKPHPPLSGGSGFTIQDPDGRTVRVEQKRPRAISKGK